ncbi:Retrovirus-related Pol polyprotein from transposon TNT 1-94 [Senna tora]|uniref:Retrovirus-related Pol polyprotein from transposon TNT 1-94 n=1 Tax=Senna tora TaxID=362788 RepID=A0A835CE50_9FABA|nr:Retrovirus-related Pol polyprotein from transposon TNT 1-94 [Senna tora]
MVKQDIPHDLDFSDFDSCVDCIKGKFPARAKSKGASRSESILDLIHIYISGLISPTTLGNYKYFITFLDDYSIFGWTDLLHEKSDSLYAFKALKAVVELKYRTIIKSVWFVRGGEFYGRYTETDNGSDVSRVINLHNEDTLLPLSSQTTSSVAHVPVLDGENRDDILVKNPGDHVVEPLIVEIAERVVDLRRSQRSRKGAIPNDYMVYLQEFQSDVVEGTDPVSYRKKLNSSCTKNFDVKFLFVRQKIVESHTCLVHILDVETSLH